MQSENDAVDEEAVVGGAVAVSERSAAMRLGQEPDPEWSEVVRAAAVRPMVQPLTRTWWLTVGALSAVVLGGFAAWGWQLTHGLGSAGYNNQAFWAVYIVDVVAFIGVSYGGAVISAILRLTGQSWRAPLTRLAEGTALVTVLIGACFIFPHLGRPERFLNIVAYPNMSSPLVWDFLAIATYSVATAIFFYLPMIPDLAIVDRMLGDAQGPIRQTAARVLSFGWLGDARQRRLLHGALTIISLVIIPLAVSVHSVLSWAFALTSRPGWFETVFPPYFVIAALYSGTALVVVVASAFRKGYHLERFITERHFVRLGYLMAALGLVYLYLTFVDLVSEGYTGITTGWIRQTVVGAYAPAFWFYVVAGELLPIVLVAVKKTRTTAGMTVAGVGVVLALWVKRIVIVLPPATQPLVAGKWGSYHFTWVSILITLAGLAAIPLLLMVLFRFVPVLSIDEMEEAGPLGALEQVSRQTMAAVTVPDEEPVPAGVASAHRPSAGRLLRRLPGFRHASGATAMVVAATAAVGLVTLAVLGAKPAGADPQPATPSASATVTLTVTAAHPGQAPLVLRAVLGTGPGQPTAGQQVTFSVVSHEFAGGGLMAIGSATTDRAGVAQTTYVPTWTGEEQFTAQVQAAGDAAPASASTTFDVTTDPPALPKSVTEYQRPLDTIGGILVRTLLAIVGAVWALLLGTLAWTVLRLPRLARR